MRRLLLATCLVGLSSLVGISPSPAEGKALNLQKDTPQSRRRLNPGDLLQAGSLDPKITFANFLGGTPGNLRQYQKGSERSSRSNGLKLQASSNDLLGLPNRNKRAASVTLGKSRNRDKNRDKKQGKGLKRRKGKGKKRNRKKDRKGRKDKKRDSKKDRRNRNKNSKKASQNSKKAKARNSYGAHNNRRKRILHDNMKPNFFYANSRNTDSIASSTINKRLMNHKDNAYYNNRRERSNYWRNKRLNKRGLDNQLPTRTSSKSKMAYEYDYKVNDNPFASNQGAPCQMYDSLTGFCVKYGFDNGCLEDIGEDGGLMGCGD